MLKCSPQRAVENAETSTMRPESRVPGFFQEAHLKSQKSPNFPCIAVVLKPLQDCEITHREPKSF
jgi:hypothetical protein